MRSKNLSGTEVPGFPDGNLYSHSEKGLQNIMYQLNITSALVSIPYIHIYTA